MDDEKPKEVKEAEDYLAVEKIVACLPDFSESQLTIFLEFIFRQLEEKVI